MIEVDVHRTKDGELVCMHDASVDRITTGTGMIKDLLWAEIAELTTKEQSDHVSRLIDIIEIIKKRAGLKLVIEIKNAELYPGIEQDIVTTIMATHSNEDVIIISFDFEPVTRVNKLNPGLKTGLLFKHPFFSVRKKLSQGQIVSAFWLSVVVDPSFVYRAHRNGNELWVWTVNSPSIVNLLQFLGVDAIVTDHPQKNRLS
jgi:glycerophosphoryl diester phosphodiesterase